MYPVEHSWTILMLKILQAHLLRAFVANLKIDAIYALYPESFCDKNLAIRKVFVFVTLQLRGNELKLSQQRQLFCTRGRSEDGRRSEDYQGTGA